MIAAATVARATAQAIDRLAAVARDELPPDVAVERAADGARLTGRRLRLRRLTDVRLRGLAPGAGR